MKRFLTTIATTCTILAVFTPLVGAIPHQLTLDPSASKVDLSVSSQVFNTAGSLTDYSGTFLYNSKNITESRLEINADASKIAFGTMPFDKMMLLTGLIRSIPNPDISFVSESISSPSPNRILVTGTAVTGRNRESITIPFEVEEVSPTGAILKGNYSRAGLIGNKNNPQSKLFGTVQCRSVFRLMFKK